MPARRLSRLGGVLPALLLLAWLAPRGWADERQRPKDLTELPLEELMKLDVLSIDVLGTHTHRAGELMLSYEYMRVEMDGNLDGTNAVSEADILRRFKVAPTHMTMEMHEPMVMFAPSNDVTLMAMIPYVLKSMDHVARDGSHPIEESSGLGDLSTSATFIFYRQPRTERRLALTAGLSFPTGSIDEEGPGGHHGHHHAGARLEYPMQLGSGTYDLLPGLTYFDQAGPWSWLAETMETVRAGKNANGYRLGNEYRVTAEVARKLTDWLSLNGRLDGRLWENISGTDRALDPTDEPTKDPDLQGGKRLDVAFGFNLYLPEGLFSGAPRYTNKGYRFAVLLGLPVYQSLDGPQLETDWYIRVALSWTLQL